MKQPRPRDMDRPGAQAPEIPVPEKMEPDFGGDLVRAQMDVPGLATLENSARSIVVATHAGDRYSTATQAALVKLELDPGPNRRTATITEFTEADFAAGSHARDRALSSAECLADQKGIDAIRYKMSEKECRQMPLAEREATIAVLQRAGYKVRCLNRMHDGNQMVAEIQPGETMGKRTVVGEPLAIEAVRDLTADRAQSPDGRPIEAPRRDGMLPAASSDATESLEDVRHVAEARLDAAAEGLRRLEGLDPERWAELDQYGKVAVLNAAGREMGPVYDIPAPPLLVDDMGNPRVQGSYGNGYSRNPHTGQVEGAEYGIAMNREAQVDFRKKLFGDDPSVALETYAHEFRHSYQTEQASAYDKPQFRNFVDDPELAGRWSQNLKRYMSPEVDYDAYRDQAVERDARAFAEELVRRVCRKS